MMNLNDRKLKELDVCNFCKHNIQNVEDLSDKELDEWITFINFMKRSCNVANG